MAITHPTGFPLAANTDTDTTPAPATVPFPHAYNAVGDLAVVGILVASGTVTVSTIMGNNSGTWTLRERNQDVANGVCVDIWTAPVISTSAADVITITYSGSTAGVIGNVWPDSITAGLGSNTLWSFPAASSTSTATAVTTIVYPSLTSATTANAQAYWGFTNAGDTATGGSSTGFSYILSTVSGNQQIYNLTLASNTTYAPTGTSTPGNYDTAALIIQAANGGGGGGVVPAGNFFRSLISGNTKFPPPEISSLSVTSGPAAGGTSTNLNGVYFPGTTSVKFGSTVATFTYHSPTSITATSPPGTGTVYVSATSPSGTSTNAPGNQFTYVSSGGNVPNAPAMVTNQNGVTYTIPTTVRLYDDFSTVYSGGVAGTNPVIWGMQPFAGGIYNNGSQPNDAGNLLVVPGTGLQMTCQGASGTGAVLCTAVPAAPNNGGNGNPAYTGYMPQATESHPVFIEYKLILAGSAGAGGVYGYPAFWATSLNSNWAIQGEIDIIECYGNIQNNFEYVGPLHPGPGFPNLNNPGGVQGMAGTTQPWPGAGVAFTMGVLWAPSNVSIFYNGIYQTSICAATVTPSGFDPPNFPGPLALVMNTSNCEVNGQGPAGGGSWTNTVVHVGVWQN